MMLGSQANLQKILYRSSNAKHFLQGMSVSKSPLQVSYAFLVPDPRRFTSDTLKFIVKEEPKAIEEKGVVPVREET